MDLFLLNGDREPGLSFTDMIQRDMETEFGFTQMDEFSSMDLDSIPIFDHPFDTDDKLMEPLFEPLERPAGTPAASHSSCSSSSSLEDDSGRMALEHCITGLPWSVDEKDQVFDLDPSTMVDPSFVLPSTIPVRAVTNISCNTQTSNSHSPNNPTLTSLLSATSTSNSPLLSSSPVLLTSDMNSKNQTPSNISQPTVFTVKTEAVQVSQIGPSNNMHMGQVTLLRPAAQSSRPLLTTTTSATHHRVPNTNATALLTTNSTVTKPLVASVRAPSAHVHTHHSSSVITSNPTGQSFRGKPTSVRAPTSRRTDDRSMPKPAYSYSCLIALALKNSMTGSLPVSEIYSFMCEYFPYFRTAPNGWKNSVRHNLSLNKCFEKIEKPVGNNQRKGCLWALNPTKVHKMDEEIQKWSKKDLQGIRDAMNTPEVLSALERGEMKFEGSVGSSLCSEDEDDDSDDTNEVSVDQSSTGTSGTTLTTLKLVQNAQCGRTSVVGQVLQPRAATLQIHNPSNITSKQPAILRQTQQKIRTNSGPAAILTTNANSLVTSSMASSTDSSPDFILPDSTMAEFSFSDCGMLVDELGNEITVKEEVVSSTDQASQSTIVSSSPRSVVLRKLPGITPVVRGTANTLRATNYVYSPAIASSHQSDGLGHLVLTNAKLE